VKPIVLAPPRPSTTPARRQFLGRLGAGSAAFCAAFGSASPAQAQTPVPTPRRHPIDDWMDALPSAHRMVFDAHSSDGLDDVLAYASNVFLANRTGYGVDSHDVGVIVVMRHNAAPYAFTDAMWAKYGGVFASALKLGDGRPSTNPANRDKTIDDLVAQGAHFAVCQMAARRFAGMAAHANNAGVDTVLEELSRNLINNAHLTPAGIVAVGRAQERGFAFGYAG